jgi:hypothetical protein
VLSIVQLESFPMLCQLELTVLSDLVGIEMIYCTWTVLVEIMSPGL